ncbi:protein brambleberry isoform X2 [Dunckerocampus dactyliophorus]|nr:protein brambleberry isoform X2 [Dunckerocampus dactyliophorus]XP_054645007.1 protein brambleberry isoform X2 [Dunckerocampus dactyliophorus]
MDHVKRVLLLCILANQCPAAGGLFEWLRQSEHPPPAAAPPPLPPPAELSPVILAKDARFEMATADEKFLAEAKKMVLSPLDSCHHRVVARLKASCESLSEEELAKLGVVLLNCQAQIEGRATYPCTEDMAIKDCTANMDSDTWNAYHIVSNRARSVCYATRQQLFRRRAEHTVNALISTAASQLSAMEDLKDGQLELREMTAASLDKLLQGHSALQDRQVKLHEGQEHMESSLRDNLQRLGQEKALIASGQQLVAQLIQGITERMEIVSENVQAHGSKVQDGHRAIAQDLADVRHQAQDIYQKIDDGMSEFLRYRGQTSQYYADLMGKLERMNSSLGFMLHYLDNMQGHIEERLHVIQGYLTWTGLSLTAMWTCIAHTGYFVLVAVLQSFLCCPVFSRATLLLIVPFNALAEVNQQPALDLTSLSLLLFALSLGHWFVSKLWACFQSRGKKTTTWPCELEELQKTVSSSNSYPRSSTPQKSVGSALVVAAHGRVPCYFYLFSVLQRWTAQRRRAGHPSDSRQHHIKRPVPCGTPSHCTPRRVPQPAFIDDIPLRNPGSVFDLLNDSHDLVNGSRSASPTPSVNSSLSVRQLCNAITKTGKACKKRALLGQDYCRVHEGGHTTSFYS